MSFYINNQNQNRPMPITSANLNNICEKVVIETTKVFDACLSQITENGIILTAEGFNPANPTLPLTFISAVTSSTTPTISNLTITRLEANPNYATVSLDIGVPVTITYRDANGVVGTARATYTVPRSVILFVPQPSLTPVDIIASVQFSSQIGTFTEPNIFTVTGCTQIILKVVAVVDLLIPSFGYPIIPPCQVSSTSESCPGFFDTPIYPVAT